MLYTELTVAQNLILHAQLFGLPKNTRTPRVFELLEQFGLKEYSDDLAADLPLGIRQRLSLAVAVIHKPELLILDEPTSGVDPIGRDRFWELLIDLSRAQNVTIFISTHFMNEAQRCDRLALMHAGKVLACDKPQAMMQAYRTTSLEEAFVALLEKASRSPIPSEKARSETPTKSRIMQRPQVPVIQNSFSLRRLLAYARRETLEIRRDHIRLAFALVAPVLLMLVCGYGITFDVEHNSYAVLDRDQTFGSRDFLDNIAGSTYFNQHSPIRDYSDLERRMQSGELRLAIEIPPRFSEDLKRGRVPEVAVWIDGAMPFRGDTIRSYMEKLTQLYLLDLAHHNFWPAPPVASPTLQFRYRYNQDFKSTNAVVPSELAILLIFIPSLSTAVGVVREKELGSITNLYATPVTRLEFLLGKQLPYVGIGTLNFLILILMLVFLFGVPLKGDFLALLLGALLYVTATTGFGLLVSAFTKTQISALFGTAILTVMPCVQFCGMLTPVSSLAGVGALVGLVYPTTYFIKISVGTITKALGFKELFIDFAIVALFVPAMTLLSLIFLKKQEK